MLLALKIDVDTYRGTLEGAPRLLEILQRYSAGATFLWSLGPDHTGRAIKRIFRPGFFKKVQRTNVAGHYGLKTLLYGTLLPGPDIGKNSKTRRIMQQTAELGFECGIHTYDHVKWQDGVANARAAWVETEMQKAYDRYVDIFQTKPRTHGAAGWQMNGHALRLTQRLGLQYCSDSRGTHPFIPIYQGEPIECPQIPTTLPTLDELIGCQGQTQDNVVAHLLQRTNPQDSQPLTGHVYTLHAELEGMKLAPQFEALIQGWLDQGWQLVPVEQIFRQATLRKLPYHQVQMMPLAGRSGTLLQQGATFPPKITNMAATPLANLYP